MRLLYECLKLIDDIQCMVLVIKDYLLQHGTKFVMDTENNQQPLNIIDGAVTHAPCPKSLDPVRTWTIVHVLCLSKLCCISCGNPESNMHCALAHLRRT